MVRSITLTALALAFTIAGAAAQQSLDAKMEKEQAAQDRAMGVESIGAEAADDETVDDQVAPAQDGMSRELSEMERSEETDGCEGGNDDAGCPGADLD
ncbi:hypothetical protein DLJ53_14625 [Acuticoccus sediminis]|uniref:Uncharacterized protein n=1 Tax=Acuticoccus sediminis TaxID=2184697 RepID=A0A8B2NQZ5_9HYPH|nr:hypothetical protein [Acuticoccus sediminis]RAI00499.1 hypothetical protein DLJ53_14625 [Acuticoccus sediminis]